VTAASYFSTQIYKAKLSRGWASLNQDLSEVVAELRSHDREGISWSKKNYPGGYTSFHSLSELHRLNGAFRELELALAPHLKSYLAKLDYQANASSFVMTDCWVNVMPAGCTHPAHIHPSSVISGTYYVAVPDGAPGIKFEDPRSGLFMHQPPRKSSARRENRTYVELAVRPGDLVLFESWLRHEVPQNRASKERVSVSFNYSC
jgi:uncharacterized protein (TIGR02466 family)